MATIMQRTHVTKQILKVVANGNQCSSKMASTLCPEDGGFTGPEMVTATPGPLSRQRQADLSKQKRTEQMHFFVDFEESQVCMYQYIFLTIFLGYYLIQWILVSVKYLN